MKLLRNLGSIGGLTLASRILALVRDSLQSRYVGANFASDAFLIAFRLPNLFRQLFAEGAFSAAFIPMFNRRVGETGELSEGLLFAERALSVLFPALVAATVVLLAAAWPLTWLISGGFHDPTPDQFAFAVTLSRITIPYLALISLVSLLGGILNSLDRYWVNAAAPILLNVAMVAGLWFFHGTGEAAAYETARVQAITVPVGGALQLAWLAWACHRAGVRLRLQMPRLDADVKQLFKLIVPAAAGAGAAQINLIISSALAGRLLDPGSISYIYYADRLNQLPLGLIGIGLGTILLPTISRLLGQGKDAEAMETQNRGIELALFLTLPATAAFMVAAAPIVQGLFEHGRFTALDTERCAWALAAFSLGLPSYVLVKVLTPGFYARHDTKTPVRYATISIAVNIVGNLLLIPLLHHVGPPLATAIASCINTAMLYRELKKRGHFAADAQLRRRVPRLALATLLMGVVLYFIQGWFRPYLSHGYAEALLALTLLVGAGVAIYIAACFLTRAFLVADLKALMRRRTAKA